jgi:hypothetical protein
LWSISSLTSAFGGSRVVDLLQNDISNVERKPFGRFQDAVWINFETPNSLFEIILSPSYSFATVYLKITSRDRATNIEYRMNPERFEGGVIFPGEIVAIIQSTLLPSNHNVTRITVKSTSPPDSFVFKKETFKELQKDYVILTMSDDGQVKSISDEVYAAPTGTRLNVPPTTNILPAPSSNNYRWVLAFIGHLLLLLALYYWYVSSRAKK